MLFMWGCSWEEALLGGKCAGAVLQGKPGFWLPEGSAGYPCNGQHFIPESTDRVSERMRWTWCFCLVSPSCSFLKCWIAVSQTRWMGLSHLQATGMYPSSPPPCGLSGKFSDQSRSGHMPHLDSQSVLRNLEDVEEASAREEGGMGSWTLTGCLYEEEPLSSRCVLLCLVEQRYTWFTEQLG